MPKKKVRDLITKVVVRPAATSFHLILGIDPNSTDPKDRPILKAADKACRRFEQKLKKQKQIQDELNAIGLANPTPIRLL